MTEDGFCLCSKERFVGDKREIFLEMILTNHF